MSFDGIYGHENVKRSLTAAIENDAVSHAYIFCGGIGVGKKTVARRFAHLLAKGSAMDVVFVTNEHYDVKGKISLSVEAVRAARVDMYTRPYLSDKKVFIFPDAQEMTVGAQNALLKVLEEPPSYCVIILITTNIGVLLPTIRSRAVTIRFAPLGDDVVAQYSKDKYGECDELLIRLSSGSIAALDKLMTNRERIDIAKEFASVFERFTGTDKLCVYEAISLFEREKENSGILFDVMGIMLSGSLFGTDGENSVIKSDGVKKGAAVKIIEKTQNAKRAISQNRNYGIVISELLLETWRILHD